MPLSHAGSPLPPHPLPPRAPPPLRVPLAQLPALLVLVHAEHAERAVAAGGQQPQATLGAGSGAVRRGMVKATWQGGS